MARRLACFAIYQIVFGWKTYTYLVNHAMKPTNSQTQGQPNPRKSIHVKSGILGHFSPENLTFRGLGSVLCMKEATRKRTQPKSPQTPCFLFWFNARNQSPRKHPVFCSGLMLVKVKRVKQHPRKTLPSPWRDWRFPSVFSLISGKSAP